MAAVCRVASWQQITHFLFEANTHPNTQGVGVVVCVTVIVCVCVFWKVESTSLLSAASLSLQW